MNRDIKIPNIPDGRMCRKSSWKDQCPCLNKYIIQYGCGTILICGLEFGKNQPFGLTKGKNGSVYKPKECIDLSPTIIIRKEQ